ncbi:MAG: hypothetical protein FRX49_04871 [Trebouxia sp. A1-2]|nr:MAG: hypothetical protein FRX49_04871 [Trebouxia sp. A1-2]
MLRCFQKSHWEIQKEEEEEEEEEEQKKKKERKTHLQRLSSGLLDGRQPLGTPPLPHTAHLLTPLSPQPVEGLDQLLQCLLDPLQSCHFSLRMVGVGDNLDGYRLPSFWPAKLRAARRAPAHPPLTTARSQASLGPGSKGWRNSQVHSAKGALADGGQRLCHKGKDLGGKVKGSQVPAALPGDVVVLQFLSHTGVIGYLCNLLDPRDLTRNVMGDVWHGSRQEVAQGTPLVVNIILVSYATDDDPETVCAQWSMPEFEHSSHFRRAAKQKPTEKMIRKLYEGNSVIYLA